MTGISEQIARQGKAFDYAGDAECRYHVTIPTRELNVLLLTTIGTQNGQRNVVPLTYFVVDERLLISAACGGAPRDPAWVSSVRAEHRVHVELGNESFDADAREIPLGKHDETWAHMLATATDYDDPRRKTTRIIPLFELDRLS